MIPVKEKVSGGKWLRVAVSFAILAFILTRVDFNVFAGTLSKLNPAWMLLALFLILLEQAVLALSWIAMLAGKGLHVPFRPMTHILVVSNFLGFALPSGMGSDVVKVVGLAKYMSNTKEALSSLVVFRAIGFAMLFMIAILAAAVFPRHLPDKPVIHTLIQALAVVVVAGMAGVALAKPFLDAIGGILKFAGMDRFHGRLVELHDSFMAYVANPASMLKASAGAFLIQSNRIACVYIASLALGLSVDPADFCLFIPVIAAMLLIPVSVSGIGVREGGFVVLFGYAGLSAGEALSLSLTTFSFDIVFMLFGGAVYWIAGFPNAEALTKAQDESSSL
ncbi:MAG: flippase-like domain-containing protein [Nitrospinae bacterium]|nr:flippase-like domain-containing protein [Nitrospinota bacterium]